MLLWYVCLAAAVNLPSCRWSDPPCIWSNEIPDDCPLPRSNEVRGIQLWEDWNIPTTGADTWYPSWGSDDILYSSFTDGCNHNNSTDIICCHSARGVKANTGIAKITGGNPKTLNVTSLSCVAEPGAATVYTGRYPSANVMKDDVWYYGTYALANLNKYCGNWCTMGPFYGFRFSTDKGQHWTLDNFTVERSIFGEVGGKPVQMGAPHVVDFGRNQEHSPDKNKIYLVGTGCLQKEPEANCSWMSGDTVNLARGTVDSKNPGGINKAENWEFFGGRDPNTGEAKWVSSIEDMKPLLVWERHTGVVTITYNPTRKLYLMAVSTPTIWPSTVDNFDTYLLESEALTGPYRIGVYMKEFGMEAYFVHFPSKFLWGSNSGHLMYSANFMNGHPANPPTSGYHLCMVNFTFCDSDCPPEHAYTAPLVQWYSTRRDDYVLCWRADRRCAKDAGHVGYHRQWTTGQAPLEASRSGPNATRPLYLHYSDTYKDNFVNADASPPDATYTITYTAGLVYTTPGSNRVPLYLYSNDAEHHHMTVGTSQGIAMAISRNCTRTAVLGYIN